MMNKAMEHMIKDLSRQNEADELFTEILEALDEYKYDQAETLIALCSTMTNSITQHMALQFLKLVAATADKEYTDEALMISYDLEVIE